MRRKISIIIPMYYESKVALECYKRINKVFEEINSYKYEMIFICDVNNSDTQETIKNLASNDNNVKLISFKGNYGQQYAVIAGIKYSSGKAVIILDSSLEEFIELIPRLIYYWKKGNNAICARIDEIDEDIELKLYKKNEFIKEFKNLKYNKIPKSTGEIRILDRRLINKINHSSKYKKLSKGFFSWKQYEKNPFEQTERFMGKTKIYSILGTIGKIIVGTYISILIYMYITSIKNINPIFNMLYVIIIGGFSCFVGLQLMLVENISGHIGKLYDDNKIKSIICEKVNLLNDEEK